MIVIELLIPKLITNGMNMIEFLITEYLPNVSTSKKLPKKILTKNIKNAEKNAINRDNIVVLVRLRTIF